MKISESEDTITAYLTGDIDHHSARNIREDIDAFIQMKKPYLLRLDFSGVSFMDSSGIGLIMGRYKLMSEQGGTVIVSRPPVYIKKVLRLAGVDRLAPIADSLDGLIPEAEENNEKEVEEIEQTTPQTT